MRYIATWRAVTSGRARRGPDLLDAQAVVFATATRIMSGVIGLVSAPRSESTRLASSSEIGSWLRWRRRDPGQGALELADVVLTLVAMNSPTSSGSRSFSLGPWSAGWRGASRGRVGRSRSEAREQPAAEAVLEGLDRLRLAV